MPTPNAPAPDSTDAPAPGSTDALTQGLAALNLGLVSPHRRRREASPPPYTATSTQTTPLRPSTPPSNSPVYLVHSPTLNGRVNHWASASHATQGVRGARVWRVDDAPQRRRGRKAGDHWVVFHGLQPGVYTSWEQARLQVDGVRGALHRKYPSPEQATAAFSFALSHSWTRTIRRDGSSASPPISTTPPPLFTVAPDNMVPIEANPLNEGIEDGKWYFVYKGITPGIYRSYLESQLNVLGLSAASHDSHNGTSQFARDHFLRASV
ncbi:hypothetical protein C8F01DRAFT_1303981 [Mycena amicta]|nr:hypothetical protein C8F01DRAFT_1303981 [Mycena amicta]